MPSTRNEGMSLRNPFTLMSQLSQQMDRVFNDFWMGTSGQQSWPTTDSSMWAPAIEVRQKDGELIVRADLPGLDQKDVQVEIENDALVLSGERREESEDNSDGRYHSECRYGSFYRTIPLPSGTNPDDVKAEFKSGVLEVKVKVPKEQESRRSIPIQAG
jgi:HSP20 family protein